MTDYQMADLHETIAVGGDVEIDEVEGRKRLNNLNATRAIGIKKRYPITVSFCNAPVPGSARAFLLLNEVRGLRRVSGFRIGKCAHDGRCIVS